MAEILVFLAAVAAFFAVAHFFLPYWLVVLGFALFLPTIFAVLVSMTGKMESLEDSLVKAKKAAGTRSQTIANLQSENEGLLRNLKGQKEEIGKTNATIEKNRNRANQAEIEAFSLRRRLKEEEALRKAMAQKVSEHEAVANEAVVLRTRIEELEVEITRLLRSRDDRQALHDSLEGLRREVRRREHWLPFEIADEDFAKALAQTFR